MLVGDFEAAVQGIAPLRQHIFRQPGQAAAGFQIGLVRIGQFQPGVVGFQNRADAQMKEISRHAPSPASLPALGANALLNAMGWTCHVSRLHLGGHVRDST